MASLFLAIDGIAQGARVVGIVIDDSTGLPGVRVMLVGEDLQHAITDIDGYFHFDSVAAGQYTLKFSFVGYQEIDRPLQVPELGRVLTIDLQNPLGLDDNPTLYVTSKRGGEKNGNRVYANDEFKGPTERIYVFEPGTYVIDVKDPDTDEKLCTKEISLILGDERFYECVYD